MAAPNPNAQNIGGSDSIKRPLKEGKRNMSFISHSFFVELYSRSRQSFKQTCAPEKYWTFSLSDWLLTLFVVLVVLPQSVSAQSQSLSEQVQRLEQTVMSLESRITTLEEQNRQLRSDSARSDGTAQEDTAKLVSAVTALRGSGPAEPQETATTVPTAANPVTTPLPGVLPGGATLNYYLDGYYEYNFNNPVGRVNDLRAYDVLSNTFSLNQADFIFALDPDLSLHRRYGFRIDLQFGQATETLQGNPANEPRPDVYRNVFQAYGSYVVPISHGLELDMGKWASSLGIEGNYAKDQMNYTRSWYYYFLPFYHQGLRANYKLNDKVAFNYWLVNGTDQSEPTNAYKDELFGLVLQPAKTVSWTVNYYNGQEHPNTASSSNCTTPVQPGLCEVPINPAPNGKLHIFDNYATWAVTRKLTLAGEGDYVIEREWANAAPGRSSAPQHVIGGAAYAQYQLTSRGALAARTEYLSDRGGLFSNKTQALKEVTATYKFNVADGLDAFLEYRHDWTNIPYFTTNNPASPTNHQDTATMGVIWWYGGKQGSW